MALPLVINSLNDVPEVVREHYVEGSDSLKGRFILDGTEVDGYRVAPVTDLKSALDKERRSAQEAAAKLKVFEGLDPEKAREAISRIERLDSEVDDKAKEQFAILRKRLEDEFKAEREQIEKKYIEESQSAETRTKVLQARLRQELITSRATLALHESGCIAPALMVHPIESMIDMTIDDNGKETIVVRGEDGNPRITRKPGSTDNMQIEELVEELKADDRYSAAWGGSNASGIGRPHAHRAGSTTNQFEGLSPQERLRAFRQSQHTS